MEAAVMPEAAACPNIGPKERAMRVRTGWFGTVLTVGTIAALLATHAAWPLRLLVMLPAGLAAFGFFQAQANTCVAFAAAGIKVLSDSRKDMVRVDSPLEKQLIAAAARTVYLRSLLAVAAVTALVMLLP